MPRSLVQTPAAFDYAALDKGDRALVEQKTTEIRDRIGRAAQNVIEIGQRLLVVKEKLDDGLFLAWLGDEFDWNRTTAWRMMSVANQFGCSNLEHANIAPSALYLLASPSTPEAVREEFVEQARNGKPVTHAAVKAAAAPPARVSELDRAGRDRITARLGAPPARVRELDQDEPDEPDEADAGDGDREADGDQEESGPSRVKGNGRHVGRLVVPDADQDPPYAEDEDARAVRWFLAANVLDSVIGNLPARETLAELRADQRDQLRQRFRTVARKLEEAVGGS